MPLSLSDEDESGISVDSDFDIDYVASLQQIGFALYENMETVHKDPFEVHVG